MRRATVRATALGALLGLGAALAVPLTVSAHALPQSSVPADGSTVQQPPKQVTITFGEDPDPRLSSITVVDASGRNVDAGPTAVVPGVPVELEVPLKPIPDGVYTVTWRTVSAVDGHLATGAFAFGVGVSPGAAAVRARASVQSPPPSILAVVARGLFFVGLLLMVGLAATSLVALREVAGFVPPVLVGAWVAAAAGTVGVVEAERETAGIGWGDVLSSSLGSTLAWRAAALAAAGVAVAVVVFARRGPRVARWGIAGAGAGAAGALWADVAASHAGSQSPVPINLVAQWVHVVAAGVWIGGLAVLVLALRRGSAAPSAGAVRRFSAMAGVCIVVVAATGVFRAVIEVGAWGRLLGTAFGVLVIVKAALLVALAGLGAVNRFVNVPKAPAVLRGLRRIASTEVVIGLATLLVAAALVNVSPPIAAGATTAAPVAAPVTVTGTDAATTVRVRLVVSPGVAGFNRFAVHVADFDTGAPVAASGVQLQFSQPLRPSLHPSPLTLRPDGDGTFAARGSNLSLNGIWEVAVVIERGDLSTEVHLQLATANPAPPVQVIREPNGLPTVYMIQLSRGRSAQVYLQPDKAGPGIFHVTFFAAGGNSEFAVSQVTVGMTAPGTAPVILPSQSLDNIGHFSADGTFPAGRTRFDVIATLPDGEVLTPFVTLTPGAA